MSSILNVPFSNGYVSTGTGARDASELDTGELQTMTGAYYRKNDPNQAWVMPGRALFGSAGGTAVKGLAICQFDSGGTDKLLASIGTTVVAATPGATGMFASLITGLNASATRFTAAHQDDRWYLCNGYDKNKCLRPDGTVRNMGMDQPQGQLTGVASTSSGATNYPTADTGSFTTATKAYDANSGSAAIGTLNAVGAVSHIWKTWAIDSNAGRHVNIQWGASGDLLTREGSSFSKDDPGTGGSTLTGSRATAKFEVSEDTGQTWTTLSTVLLKSATATKRSFSFNVTATSEKVQVRATLTYLVGTGYVSLDVFEVQISWGSQATNFSTTVSVPASQDDGILYAYTEYNDADNLESAPSQLSARIALSTQNQVLLTRPATVNASATHWRVYRGVDGGPNTVWDLGRVAPFKQTSGDLLISQTTFLDTFNTGKNTQLLELIPSLEVGKLNFPRDLPPPTFINLVSWNGSLCGISREFGQTRTLRYSEAGDHAESWPAAYQVSSFPLEEHDDLVGQMPVGETLVLLCRGAVLAIDNLPRVVDGQFNGASARPLKGHPGCVGEYAYTTFSVAGEPRGAWVSPFGVYVTNGQVCACISLDLAWELEVNVPFLSNSVLRWDQKNLILWFEFDLDGDGLNDREMPFHMAQTHSKGEARPKLGQPTAKATSCMASALISSTHYRFSGHPSNGEVYVEESGYQDAATAANVAMVLRTAQVSHDKVDLGIVKATVNHCDFGTGETGTLTATIYRDMANTETSRAQSVRLDGNRGTTVGIGRAGELVDFTLAYSGTGSGGVAGVSAEIDGQGRSGSAARWQSSSATP
jgi:hypothetical protein